MTLPANGRGLAFKQAEDTGSRDLLHEPGPNFEVVAEPLKLGLANGDLPITERR
jgi:hypothetical protein